MWKEHLQALDFLRSSIGLRAYGQKDPLNEYKKEAFRLFESLLLNVREKVTQTLCFAEFKLPSEMSPSDLSFEKPETPTTPSETEIPRNALCPCGSGKRYKHCCGKLKG